VVGVFKDWLVIIASSIVFQSVVAPAQWVGYSIAFVGIVMYTHYKYEQYLENQAADKERGPLLERGESTEEGEGETGELEFDNWAEDGSATDSPDLHHQGGRIRTSSTDSDQRLGPALMTARSFGFASVMPSSFPHIGDRR
jgi:hypothetical protein